MDRKVVKRRGGGRPNRGGGRHNRRGRGNSNPRPPGPSVSARKGGAGLYDDDDMYTFDDYETDEPDLFTSRHANPSAPKTQYSRGQSGRARYVYIQVGVDLSAIRCLVSSVV